MRTQLLFFSVNLFQIIFPSRGKQKESDELLFNEVFFLIFLAFPVTDSEVQVKISRYSQCQRKLIISRYLLFYFPTKIYCWLVQFYFKQMNIHFWDNLCFSFIKNAIFVALKSVWLVKLYQKHFCLIQTFIQNLLPC